MHTHTIFRWVTSEEAIVLAHDGWERCREHSWYPGSVLVTKPCCQEPILQGDGYDAGRADEMAQGGRG